MRITHIVSESPIPTKDRIVLVTDPPLTAGVFAQIEVTATSFQFHRLGDCLVLDGNIGEAIASGAKKNFRRDLEKMLTEAEGRAANMDRRCLTDAEEKAATMVRRYLAMLTSVSEQTGIPLAVLPDE